MRRGERNKPAVPSATDGRHARLGCALTIAATSLAILVTPVAASAQGAPAGQGTGQPAGAPGSPSATGTGSPGSAATDPGSRLVGPYEIADGSPHDFAGVTIASRRLTLRRGRTVAIAETCPRATVGQCIAALSLAFAPRHGPPGEIARTAIISIRPGETVHARLLLPHAVTRLMHRGQRARLIATLASRDILGTTRTISKRITLRVARRR